MGPADARRRGFTVLELMVVATIIVVVLAITIHTLISGRRSSQALGTRLSLAQASRKAFVRLLGELQEGMEVLSPRPGTTRGQALVRDKLSLIRWYVLHPKPGATPEIYDLWRYTSDASLPADRRSEMLLGGVKRLRFTCLSEGALQINLTLSEEGKEYSILTTVMLRNLPSSEAVW